MLLTAGILCTDVPNEELMRVDGAEAGGFVDVEIMAFGDLWIVEAVGEIVETYYLNILQQ